MNSPRLPQLLAATIAGGLFAVGLVLSGMTDPQRVLAFLDVSGAWNPSLAFVMAGAIAVYAPVAKLVAQRRRQARQARQAEVVDRHTVAGAAIFGVGWGFAGICPGPALVSLGSLRVGAITFFVAMLAALWAAKLLRPQAASCGADT